VEDGYQIQNAMIAWNAMEGNRVEGWTMEATSPKRRSELDIPEPICGPLFASDIQHFMGDNIPTLDLKMLGGFTAVELTFAMQLRYEMLPRDEPYTIAEIAQAVDSVIPALNLRATRLDYGNEAPPVAMIVGDAASAGVLICGDVWEVSKQVEEQVANKWGGGKMNPSKLSQLTQGAVALYVNDDTVANGMNQAEGQHPLELLTFLVSNLDIPKALYTLSDRFLSHAALEIIARSTIF
jgi:2-keto-4-pentenoate hydratase